MLATFFNVDRQQKFMTAVVTLGGPACGKQQFVLAPAPGHAIRKRGEHGLQKLIVARAIAASSIPVFGNPGCLCADFAKGGRHQGGCQFDKKTAQCVNTGCQGVCS